ncbi:hypothetical protein V1498_09610 [Peribacillus sp. SCS-26]|uniref:hypothetical protein n=1 Tax=Paraperibacillus marinus TaxID=3115295 RepID=UPI003906A099
MAAFNSWKNRRESAKLSLWGTSIIHARNPVMVALWSMAFPGYGHLLLNKYIRGYALIAWEFFINQETNLNLAIIYTFTGSFSNAKSILNLDYLYLYIPIYLFSIWDSYRSTVEMNNIYYLDKKRKKMVEVQVISPFEINYLEKRKPLVAVLWSMAVPSLGQFYLNHIFSALFALVMTLLIVHYSHFLEAFHLLLLGDIKGSTAMIKPQWLLYLPSLYFFNIYESYERSVENNKLFEMEQKRFLQQRYQGPVFRVKKGIWVK